MTSRSWLIGVWVGALVAGSLAAAGWASSPQRERYDVEVFARVGTPGQPEGIAVDRLPGGTRRVYVGTSPKDATGSEGKPPSKLFAYGRRGRLRDEWTISGQDTSDPFYGILGLAIDGRHRVYAADVAPARVIRLDPRTDRQVDYATFADVPPCTPTSSAQCSETVLDRAPLPDYGAFAPNGAMYVSDHAQALIWRVPPGGGEAKVWLTHPGLETIFGPNGVWVFPRQREILFALTNEDAPGPPEFPAGLYKVRIRSDGSAGNPRLFWSIPSNDAPDGFAVGRSGRAYVALASPAGNPGIAVVSPRGELLERVPATPAENAAQEIPFDAPAGAAFLGRRLLVTNHAFVSRDESHYAVLDLFADERGAHLSKPYGP